MLFDFIERINNNDGVWLPLFNNKMGWQEYDGGNRSRRMERTRKLSEGLSNVTKKKIRHSSQRAKSWC